MRNFLAFVGAAVVVFLGLGWYLGWYRVTPKQSAPGQSSLQVDINRDKISQDVQKGTDNVSDLIEKTRQQNQSGSGTADVKPGASLQPPQSTPGTRPAGQLDGASPRAKDAFRGLIVDGWFSGEKK